MTGGGDRTEADEARGPEGTACEPQGAPAPEDEAPSSVKVKAELGALHGFASTFSRGELRDGTWLPRFLRHALAQYSSRVNAAYFKEKYPGLPADAIVERRIALAKRYAALNGALSAAAYTGVMAATLGTGGAASPLTLPAAALTFMANLFFVTKLQLELTYDIATLYGHSINMDDAEDMYELIMIAFGIKAAEVLRDGAAKLAPDLARTGVQIADGTGVFVWFSALPFVGKYLVQRTLIQFAIPAVGIPLSAGFNYYSTGRIAKAARQLFRDKAAIGEAAREIGARSEADPLLVLKTVYLVAKADGEVGAEEGRLLSELVDVFEDVEGAEKALAAFRRLVSLREEAVLDEVRAAPEEARAEVYQAAVCAAAVNHEIRGKEREALRRLAEAAGVPFDEAALEKAAEEGLVR